MIDICDDIFMRFFFIFFYRILSTLYVKACNLMGHELIILLFWYDIIFTVWRVSLQVFSNTSLYCIFQIKNPIQNHFHFNSCFCCSFHVCSIIYLLYCMLGKLHFPFLLCSDRKNLKVNGGFWFFHLEMRVTRQNKVTCDFFFFS